jgi:hypothetical protein
MSVSSLDEHAPSPLRSVVVLHQQPLTRDIAGFEHRSIAVERIGVDVAIERIARDAPLLESFRRPAGSPAQASSRRDPMREDLGPIDGEEFNRRPVSDQVGVRQGNAQIEARFDAPVTEAAEEPERLESEKSRQPSSRNSHVAVVTPASPMAAGLD